MAHVPSSPRLVAAARGLPPPLRWAATAALVAGSLGVVTLLEGRISDPQPFLLLLPPVILAAILFDRIAAGLAVLLAAAAGCARFLPHPPAAADFASVVIFVAVAGAIAAALGERRDSKLALRRAEDAYHLAERRRGLLLTEFRHRSRNDLLSLSALLQLRARRAPSAAAGDALREAATHATTLSRVHARLAPRGTTPDDPATVDTHAFVEGLANDLFEGQAAALRPVALRVHAEPHKLDTERAVPLGLALNELIANAYSYGFPDERPGGVEIGFRREDGSFVLAVADNGVGMTEPATPRDGLGTRLLTGLAAQLRGSFWRGPAGAAGGTRAELRFPVAPPA